MEEEKIKENKEQRTATREDVMAKEKTRSVVRKKKVEEEIIKEDKEQRNAKARIKNVMAK